MESASVAGVILDSSVIIAAERRGHTVRQIPEQVRVTQGEIEIGVSVVTIAEPVRGLTSLLLHPRLRDPRADLPLQHVERHSALLQDDVVELTHVES